MLTLVHRQKARLLNCMEFLTNPESVLSFTIGGLGDSEAVRDMSMMIYRILVQYARRVIWHEPTLHLKALDKVSFKDLLLSDDFSVEDIGRFYLLFSKRLEIGLLWFKDAVMEALAMSRPGLGGTSANVGDPSQCQTKFISSSWLMPF